MSSDVHIWLSLHDATSCLSLRASLMPLLGRYSLLNNGPRPITMAASRGAPSRIMSPRRASIDGSNDLAKEEPSEFQGTDAEAETILPFLQHDLDLISFRLPVLLQRLKIHRKSTWPLRNEAGETKSAAIARITVRLRTELETVIRHLESQLRTRHELPESWVGLPRYPVRNLDELSERLDSALSIWADHGMSPEESQWLGTRRRNRFPSIRQLCINAVNALKEWKIDCIPEKLAAQVKLIPDEYDGDTYDRISSTLPDLCFWIHHQKSDTEIRKFIETAKVELSESESKVRKAKDFIRENGPIRARPIAKHINVSVERFRSYYLPILKSRGVRTIKGQGYACDET